MRAQAADEASAPLLLLGGAARAGKTLLARRLLRERAVPYLSLDLVKMGVARGWPALGLRPDAPSDEVGERLWPMTRAMAINLAQTRHLPYLLEGDALPPRHVAALRDELADTLGVETRVCFLGYADIAPGEMLARIRQWGGEVNDWTAEQPDAAVLGLVEEMLDFSRALRAECARYALPYLDIARDFAAASERAYGLLTIGSPA